MLNCINSFIVIRKISDIKSLIMNEYLNKKTIYGYADKCMNVCV